MLDGLFPVYLFANVSLCEIAFTWIVYFFLSNA